MAVTVWKVIEQEVTWKQKDHLQLYFDNRGGGGGVRVVSRLGQVVETTRRSGKTLDVLGTELTGSALGLASGRVRRREVKEDPWLFDLRGQRMLLPRRENSQEAGPGAQFGFLPLDPSRDGGQAAGWDSGI